MRKWSLPGAVAAALLLLACDTVTTWPERMNTDEVRIMGGQEIRIRYRTWHEVNDLCGFEDTDVLGCATWWPTLDFVPCYIITTPNREVLEHEIRHCLEGAFHSHTTRKISLKIRLAPLEISDRHPI